MAVEMLSASSLIGDKVTNAAGDNLGKIEDLMIDLSEGCVDYAVLSFGGTLGIGDKLFPVPWQALTVDTRKKAFILNVDRDILENAPGFDKDNWPTDRATLERVFAHYGFEPRWGKSQQMGR